MRVIQKIKQQGALNLLAMTLARIIPKSFLRMAVMDVFELDVESATGTPMSEELLIESVENDPAKRGFLQDATWNEAGASELEKHYGYLARLKEPVQWEPTAELQGMQFAGGLWCATGEFPEKALGFRLMFEPQQAWIYAAYVNKAIRGQNVYQRTLACACDDLDRRGWKELLVAVAPWNKASMYVHQKHSKRKLGRIIAIRFLKFAAVFRLGKIQKSNTFTTDYVERPIKIAVQTLNLQTSNA